ncbi:MAG: glycerol kinase GlpK [Planctomycetes bacterium]|nr:glycerol kinase GlpK [Planctomycetota bacterium]
MGAQGSSKPVVLAIDQGTTGTKALLLDASLRVLSEAGCEFAQHFPRPGWVEHEPDEIFESVRASVVQAIAQAGVDAGQIAAIGITNQRETTLIWDAKTGRALHRAIVWQDRRTADFCRELEREGLEEIFRRKTGLVIDPYFSGTKIRWILDQSEGAREAAARRQVLFGTVDSYLAWRLTAGASHVTDVSNASRTLLMDLRTCRWDAELAELLDIPTEFLPEIVDNDQIFGETRGAGFLPDGIPIAALVGDQQAALFGQVCFQPGEAKCTYGTGAFVVLNTGEEIIHSRRGMLSTAAWKIGGKTTYALEGSCFVAGAVVQWLRDGLGLIRSSEEIEALAASVDDAGGVVFVPALTGLGAPYWNPQARGSISGLTRGTTAAHIARAALEGIAFQIHDILEAMKDDLGAPVLKLKVDGGAARNDLLLAFQADILGIDVIRPQITSTTSVGAALQAGLAVGLFPSIEAIREVWKEERRFSPQMDAAEADERRERWRRALAAVRA